MNHNSIPKRAGLLYSIKRLAVVVIVVSAATAANAQGAIGTWQGSLSTGEIQRIVLKIADAGKGTLRGTIMFVDRSPDAVPLLSVTYSAPELTMAIAEFSFRGKLSADGKTIAGTWTQRNQSFPLTFTLATTETMWTYSGPVAVPPMATTADPTFEVSTIKPSPPDAKNWGYAWQTRLFQGRDNTVADLIKFAWQVRRRQIDGGDSWTDKLHFDITGEPDAPGLPSFDQQRLMLRKLLADRFGLKVHIEQRDFPVYALVADKGPPKIEASDPSGTHMGFSLRELDSENTAMQFHSTTMPEFADLLMNFIKDRQIVDETGLSGRFDFTLKLATSTMGSGSEIDKATAFLLGVQPLGLKLIPKREPLQVIVIDHVEMPSPN